MHSLKLKRMFCTSQMYHKVANLSLSSIALHRNCSTYQKDQRHKIKKPDFIPARAFSNYNMDSFGYFPFGTITWDLNRWIVKLKVDGFGGNHQLSHRSFAGTGTIINFEGDKMYVLTCAHVLDISGVETKDVVVALGNRTLYATRWYVYPSYEHSDIGENDLAIVEFQLSNDIDRKTFSIPGHYFNIETIDLRAYPHTGVILGYPAQKDGELTLWRMKGTGRLEDYRKGIVSHDIYSSAGQSGGPIISNNTIIGILKGGVRCMSADKNSSCGVSFNRKKAEWIQSIVVAAQKQKDLSSKSEYDSFCFPLLSYCSVNVLIT